MKGPVMKQNQSMKRILLVTLSIALVAIGCKTRLTSDVSSKDGGKTTDAGGVVVCKEKKAELGGRDIAFLDYYSALKMTPKLPAIKGANVEEKVLDLISRIKILDPSRYAKY